MNILLGKNTMKHANYNYLSVKLSARSSFFNLLSETQDFSVLMRNMKRPKKREPSMFLPPCNINL